jgi:hypothetical protein
LDQIHKQDILAHLKKRLEVKNENPGKTLRSFRQTITKSHSEIPDQALLNNLKGYQNKDLDCWKKFFNDKKKPTFSFSDERAIEEDMNMIRDESVKNSQLKGEDLIPLKNFDNWKCAKKQFKEEGGLERIVSKLQGNGAQIWMDLFVRHGLIEHLDQLKS